MTMPVRHISATIRCPLADAYAFLAEPVNFPVWAEGLGHSFRHVEGLDWSVETPGGRMTVRFSPVNEFGILDHWVTPEGGAPMFNPMRVFANEAGCEVVFALFRRPGMSDADVENDAAFVAGDLARLQATLEERAQARPIR